MEQTLPLDYEIYNNASEVRQHLTSELFLARQCTGTEGQLALELDSVESEKSNLDLSFVKTESPEHYLGLYSNYSNLLNRTQTIHKKCEDSKIVISEVTQAGGKTSEGVDYLITKVNPSATRAEKEEISSNVPTVFALLSFFSLSSLSVILFIVLVSYISTRRRANNKLVIYGSLLLLFFSLLGSALISGGTYYILKEPSQGNDISDFKQLLIDSNQASILVRTEGVPKAAQLKMLSCANTLKEKLGVPASIYVQRDDTCTTEANTSLSYCYESVPEPIIVFEYSPSFSNSLYSTAYVKKALFQGDESFFDECVFANYLSVEKPDQQNETSSDIVIEES